jgi:aldose 1-epimerase
MTITQQPYGVTADGQPVSAYTLKSAGLEATIITYGGILASVRVPDRYGRPANIALGLPNLAAYETRNGPYLGALIGRFGNRIDRGTFTLDGQTYHVDINEGAASLHGGRKGFDKRVWQAEPLPGGDGLRLSYHSADGECGYPGNLDVTVVYRLDGDHGLALDYRAVTDRPTIVNLTNHSYWNLRGEGTGGIDNHLIQINASRLTPTRPDQIPTGELAPVDGTPFDLRGLRVIAADLRSSYEQIARAKGYDHNWVLDRPSFADTTLIQAARVYEPTLGRTLEVWTTEPGIQFYSGNFLDGTVYGTSGRAYRQGDGLALETQHFPDAPNHANFPSTVLRPGETYQTTTLFKFGTDAA